ncbi:MAG TPA: hypothetical protein VFB99_01515 [Vicinamibacterales bacterium]|nr:hypothetical protein [Vicinamibacterales bacterium]
MKVIYAGLPGGTCADERCACMWGLASWAAAVWFTGWIMSYTGSYWPALWSWMFGEVESE